MYNYIRRMKNKIFEKKISDGGLRWFVHPPPVTPLFLVGVQTNGNHLVTSMQLHRLIYSTYQTWSFTSLNPNKSFMIIKYYSSKCSIYSFKLIFLFTSCSSESECWCEFRFCKQGIIVQRIFHRLIVIQNHYILHSQLHTEKNRLIININAFYHSYLSCTL